MVLTKQEGGEVFFTYHAGPKGKDVVDKSLAAIAQTGSYTYFLLRFE